METASELLLYAVVGFPALVVALFLLSLGPLGLLVAGFVVLGALATATWVSDDADAPPDRTNCTECGSPNAPERDRCEYCEAALEAR